MVEGDLQTKGGPQMASDDQQMPKLSHQRREDATRANQTSRIRGGSKILMNYYGMSPRWVHQLVTNISEILTELHIYDLIREMRIFLSNHPFVAVVVAIIAISCGIPILIFVVFAVITVVFTFGGFLIIEGAILAAGSFALLLCLTSMAVVFVTLGFLGGLLYITYMQIDSMVRISGVSGETMQPFDSRIPRVLASLQNISHSNRHSHGRSMHSTVTSHAPNGHLHKHHSKKLET